MQDRKPREVVTPSRRLTLQYNAVTIGGAVLLLVLVSLLFFHQYRQQCEQQRDYLEKKVSDRASSLENFMASTPFYVQQLSTAMSYYLEHGIGGTGADLIELPSDSEGFFAIDSVPAGYDENDLGNLFGSGSFSDRVTGGDRTELMAALNLFPIFKAGHREIPHVAWSYYQSKKRFTAIYPWAATRDIIGDDPSLTVSEVIDRVLEMDLMALGKPRANPNGQPYWTPIYEDPGGKGLMVSHGVPVYARGRFFGIVGADITSSAVHAYTDDLGYANGLMMVTNARGEVLAANRRDRLPPDRVVDGAALLPEGIAFPEAATPGGLRTEGHVLYRCDLGSVPWSLLYVLPESDLSRSGYGMAGYLVILVGVGLFVFSTYLVLLRRFVRPAIALTEHIRAAAVEGGREVPRVPSIWRPWFKTVSDTFALETVTSNLPGAVYRLEQEDGALVTSFISDGIVELTGLEGEQRNRWLELILDEDLAELTALIRKSALDLEPFDYECRSRTTQDDYRWIKLASKPRREPSGEVVWEGLVLDITVRKLAEEALRESEERVRSILDAPLVPIAISHTETRRLSFINARAAELFATTVEEAIGSHGPDYWVEESARHELDKMVREHGMVERYEARLLAENGEPFWALLSAIRMSYQGEPSLMMTFIDITERKQLEEDLERAATLDSLTGTLNRRHFLELTKREVERAIRHGSPLSALMVDIDLFKTINDTHGHPAGDEVIRVMAQTCSGSIRSIDVLGRLGGEEFAIALTETPLEAAAKTAERLRQTIEATPVIWGGREIRFTISVGVAVLGPSDQSIEDMLDRADRALYQAKRGGRNKVVTLEDGT